MQAQLQLKKWQLKWESLKMILMGHLKLPPGLFKKQWKVVQILEMPLGLQWMLQMKPQMMAVGKVKIQQ